MRLSPKCFMPVGCGLMFTLGFLASGYQYILLTVATEFGMTNTGMGALAAVYFAALIAAPLAMAAFIDRIGKKKVVTIFSGVFAVGCAIVFLIGQSAATVCIGVFVTAAGLAIVEGTTAAAITDSDPIHSNRNTNLSQMFFSFGSVVSPLLIAWLMELGMNWRGLFGISGALMLLLVAMLLWVRPLPVRGEAESADGKGLFKPILTILFLLFFVTECLYILIESGAVFFANPYFVQELGDNTNGALALSLLWAAMLPARFIGGFIKNRKAFIAGCFGLAALVFLVLVLTRSSSIAVICCICYGLFGGAIFPTVMSITMDAHPSRTGLAANIIIAAAGVGGAVSNLLMGVISDAVGVGNAYWFMVLMCVVAIVVFLLAMHRLSQRDRGVLSKKSV